MRARYFHFQYIKIFVYPSQFRGSFHFLKAITFVACGAICLQNMFCPTTTKLFKVSNIFLAPNILQTKPVIWYVYNLFIFLLFVAKMLRRMLTIFMQILFWFSNDPKSLPVTSPWKTELKKYHFYPFWATSVLISNINKQPYLSL